MVETALWHMGSRYADSNYMMSRKTVHANLLSKNQGAAQANSAFTTRPSSLFTLNDLHALQAQGTNSQFLIMMLPNSPSQRPRMTTLSPLFSFAALSLCLSAK